MLTKPLKKAPQYLKFTSRPLLFAYPHAHPRIVPFAMLHIPRYAYFLQDIIGRKMYESKSIILPGAMHLYVQRIVDNQFNEKTFVFVMNQVDKIVGANADQIKQIIDFGFKNLDQIQQFKTTNLILIMAYRHKYNNPQIIYKIAEKSFKLLKQHNQLYKQKAKSFSYPVCKLFIVISKTIGLSRFTDQHFKNVKIENIKILFLVHILELFWREKLQDKFLFPAMLLKCIKESEKYIPFSDLHHIEMVAKIIKDPQFQQIAVNIKNRVKQNTVQPQLLKQESQNLQQDQILLQNQFQDKGRARKAQKNNKNQLKSNKNINQSQSQEDVDGQLNSNYRNDKIIRQKKGQETRFGVQVTALLYMEYLKDLRTKYL